MQNLKFVRINIDDNSTFFEIIKKQLSKIREEWQEAESAYLDSKYSHKSIDALINECFDVMQSAYTLINYVAEGETEIEKYNEILLEKLESRGYGE